MVAAIVTIEAKFYPLAAGMFLLPRKSRSRSNPRTPSIVFDRGYIFVTGGTAGKNRSKESIVAVPGKGLTC
jgi:hypothetical protein